jgi:predicted kinase
MEAYVMVGAPGSGKSTEAKKIADREKAVIVSGDDIRAELYGSAQIQGNWTEIHDRIEEEVEKAAALGRTVILDGTHYRAAYRRQAIAMLNSYGYVRVEAVVVNPSLATCLARNFQRRERNVPDYVIKEMHGKLQPSLKEIYREDFSRINFIL